MTDQKHLSLPDKSASTPEDRFLDLWEENIRLIAAKFPRPPARNNDD